MSLDTAVVEAELSLEPKPKRGAAKESLEVSRPVDKNIETKYLWLSMIRNGFGLMVLVLKRHERRRKKQGKARPNGRRRERAGKESEGTMI